ncbi:MAG TPA: TonB family protein [Rhodothermales bacterium]
MLRNLVLPLALASIAFLLTACSKKAPEPTAEAPAPAVTPPGTASAPDRTEDATNPAVPDITMPQSDVAPLPDPSTEPAAVRELAQGAQPDGTAELEVRQPEPRWIFPPHYPLPLRMEGVEGVVRVELSIDETGSVTNAAVTSSSEPGFDEYVVEAVRSWKFRPAIIDGKAEASRLTLPYEFRSEFGSLGIAPDSPLANLRYVDGKFYSVDPQTDAHTLATIPRPMRLDNTRPPDLESMEGKEFTALLAFSVTTEGRVVEPEIVEGADKAWNDACLATVVWWQFVPQIRDGTPVKCRVKQVVRFGRGSSGQGE